MKVIRFNAVWCPGCLVMGSIWQSIEKDFPKMEMVVYDYDMEEALAKQYQIGTVLPVAILFGEKGQEIDRLIGEKNKKEVMAFLRKGDN